MISPISIALAAYLVRSHWTAMNSCGSSELSYHALHVRQRHGKHLVFQRMRSESWLQSYSAPKSTKKANPGSGKLIANNNWNGSDHPFKFFGVNWSSV
jgi:hypothetical protein